MGKLVDLNQLFLLAADDSIPLEIRYDIVRQMIVVRRYRKIALKRIMTNQNEKLVKHQAALQILERTKARRLQKKEKKAHV